MPAFRDLSIKRKLTFSGVATSIVVLMLASAAFAAYLLTTYREDTIANLESTAFIVATNCTVTLSVDDAEAAEQLLSVLAKQPAISAAGIFDAANKPFASYLRTDVGPALLPTIPSPDGHHFIDGDLLVFEPITYEGNRLGTIFIRSDTEALNNKLRNGGLLVLLVMLISSLLAYLLSVKLQAFVSDPILQLAQTARVISSQRDYTLRAKSTSRDEVGRLVDAFNQMLEALQHEISERHEAQEQAAILARFPNENPNQILRFTKDGTVAYANPPAAVLLDFWQVEVGDDLPEVWKQKVIEVFASGESEEIELVNDDAHIFSLTFAPVVEHGYLNIYGRNITARRQSEIALNNSKAELEEAHSQLQAHQAQMLQAEKMTSIGQLAAGVAHELNNPIAFIFSNFSTLEEYVQDLSMLLASYDTLEEYINQADEHNINTTRQQIKQLKEDLDLDFLLTDIDELISESRDGVERVRNIVLNLKELSHVDKDQQMPTNLNQSLESTLTLVHGDLIKKAELVKEFGELPEVLCYPRELNQAFMGMLLNAAQAIEDKGQIKIRTYHDNGYVCVDITDTGSGMPPDVQKRIFEPFYTTKDVGSGTGMGLSMAYNTIVTQHGGQLLVDSKEGTGTTFTVKIPT